MSLGAEEIAQMRSEVEDAFPDDVDIQRRTLHEDPTTEEGSLTWATVHSVKGRLETVVGTEMERTGGIGTVASTLVRVPAGTDVLPTDRVLVAGRTFQVTGIAASGDWELSRDLTVEEVS